MELFKKIEKNINNHTADSMLRIQAKGSKKNIKDVVK
jgi:hypothetical protein